MATYVRIFDFVIILSIEIETYQKYPYDKDNCLSFIRQDAFLFNIREQNMTTLLLLTIFLKVIFVKCSDISGSFER